MRVLIDVTHPFHVHIFKHLIRRLEAEGHHLMIAARNKDVTLDLLDALAIPYHLIGTRRSGIAAMAGELIERWGRLWLLARRFRPDVMVAEVGVSIGLVGASLGIPRVVFDQADLASLQRGIGMPFATVLCTGEGYLKNHARQVPFRGFLSQAYLGSGRFQPDPQALRDAGVNPEEPFIVLRLVSWSATHDVGRKGLTEDGLRLAVEKLSPFGRVLINSEKPLPAALQAYADPVPPVHFHDLLGLAQLCIAEGGTVAVEAGIQGTPAIRCNSYDFGYLQALDRYGLTRRASDWPAALAAAESLLQDDARHRQWQRARRQLEANTEDVMAFMQRIVEQAAGGATT